MGQRFSKRSGKKGNKRGASKRTVKKPELICHSGKQTNERDGWQDVSEPEAPRHGLTSNEGAELVSTDASMEVEEDRWQDVSEPEALRHGLTSNEGAESVPTDASMEVKEDGWQDVTKAEALGCDLTSNKGVQLFPTDASIEVKKAIHQVVEKDLVEGLLPNRTDSSNAPRVLFSDAEFNEAKVKVKHEHNVSHNYQHSTVIHHHHHYHGSFGQNACSSSGSLPTGEKLLGLSTSESFRAIEYNTEHSIKGNSDGAEDQNYTSLSATVSMLKKPMREGIKVYRGKQKQVEKRWRDIAVKIVPHSPRSLTEVDILLKLDKHPNLVHIYDSGIYQSAAPEIFIAMELCSQNLWEYIEDNKQEKIGFMKNAIYTKQLLYGLTFMHNNNIIHGDLKPDNILLSICKSRIKISDFGLSKEIPESCSKAPTSTCGGGTYGFKAPELCKEKPQASAKSDTFSFGIVTCLLFSNGKHPFGADPHEWSYNIKNGIKSDLSQILSQSQPFHSKKYYQLKELLRHSLQNNVKSRPTDEELQKSDFFEGVPRELDDRVGKEILVHGSYESNPPNRFNIIAQNIAFSSTRVAIDGGLIEKSDSSCKSIIIVSNTHKSV